MSSRGKSRNWLLYGPLIAGALLLGVYGVFWNLGAKEMRRSIANWAEDQRAAGMDVSYDRLATRGFPFFLRGAVSNVIIADGATWEWKAPRLYVDALPLALNRLIFSAREPHIIKGAEIGEWRINAPDGRASIGADKGRMWIVDIQTASAHVEKVGGDGGFDADSFFMTVAPSKDDHGVIEASLAVTGLGMQDGPKTKKFEAMLAASAIDAFEEGPQVWCANGGRVELRRVYLETEASSLLLSGVLSLDVEGRPQGVLNVEAVNPGPIALLLVEAGVIDSNDAQKAAAALTIAAIAGGGKISTPLMLEDGAAMIAGVRIAKLSSVF